MCTAHTVGGQFAQSKKTLGPYVLTVRKNNENILLNEKTPLHMKQAMISMQGMAEF